jgi:hypothetical protein
LWKFYLDYLIGEGSINLEELFRKATSRVGAEVTVCKALALQEKSEGKGILNVVFYPVNLRRNGEKSFETWYAEFFEKSWKEVGIEQQQQEGMQTSLQSNIENPHQNHVMN